MVKLNELPPEIVDMVVRVGSDASKPAERRYQDLGSFSRISPVFQDPSQRVMNERVVLKKGRSMQVWLHERKEGFVMKELELDLPGDSDGTMAQENLVARVIRACSPSLQKLKVSGHHQFDRSILAEANLKNLTTLVIKANFEPAPIHIEFSFPQLQQLSIADNWSELGEGYHGQLLSGILVGAGPALTALTLSGTSLEERDFSEIDLVAHQLKTLIISTAEGSLLPPPEEFLQHCDHIETLKLDLAGLSRLFDILSFLPAPSLVNLQFYIYQNYEEEISPEDRQEIDSILSLPHLANLKSLRLVTLRDPNGPEFPDDPSEAEDEVCEWALGWEEKGVMINVIW